MAADAAQLAERPRRRGPDRGGRSGRDRGAHVSAGGRAQRVAIVCPYSLSVFGGVQGQVLGLAHALRQRGFETRVIAPCDGPPPEPGITTVGPTRRFPSNGSIAPITSNHLAAARTLEALRNFAPDVVHLHEPLTPGPTHAALVGTDLPVVGTFHACYSSGYNKWYAALRRPLQRMIDRLTVCTAVSPEASRDVQTAFGVDCRILFNGVEVEHYARAEPWPSEEPTIMFVGRHESRKGLDLLLDAFAALDRPARLWVASAGPQTEALRARGVPGVEWLGRITEAEKARRLRGAAIACFPSIEGESFGVVLLEAMAAGTAVVASDLTGYRAVARTGDEARLVPVGDVAALTATL
ncbi:MAG: glycosyltransferase family 4 protein, partial [Actinobacteria bacterium]|nr:glycosyltransferase family 4 protein [Actinomycetota bacterium]